MGLMASLRANNTLAWRLTNNLGVGGGGGWLAEQGDVFQTKIVSGP